jgi:hypothetical protein
MRALMLVLALAVAGCARVDTNGYYVKGGGTGPIHCKGACP